MKAFAFTLLFTHKIHNIFLKIIFSLYFFSTHKQKEYTKLSSYPKLGNGGYI